jgi:membrane protein involved in colicin uptake
MKLGMADGGQGDPDGGNAGEQNIGAFGIDDAAVKETYEEAQKQADALRLVEDRHMLFVVTGERARFPASLGMTRG